MRCPYCGSADTQVKDSRPTEDSAAIRRRRVCGDCGGRFTTFERVQLRDLVVVKKSGRRVPFDRDKLSRSVSTAVRQARYRSRAGRPHDFGVVRQLESLGDTEISSETIGAFVMDGLKELDDVALCPLRLGLQELHGRRRFPVFPGRTWRHRYGRRVMASNTKDTPAKRQANQRGAARLAAVQALYQMDIGEISLERDAGRLRRVPARQGGRGRTIPAGDEDFFRQIVKGVVASQLDIDPMIDATCRRLAGNAHRRLAACHPARVGVRIAQAPDIPAGVVISEYLDVAPRLL